MKILFDLLPVILFFVAFRLFDVYVATSVAIAASVLQFGWLKLRGKTIEPMQWASLVIIVVFGGLTLYLHDETFIKWKPTVLHGSFALALLVSRYGFGRNLIESMMDKSVRLPDAVWDRLNLAWVLFFVGMAAVNLYVVYNFPTATWVNFKLFGSIGLTMAFVIAQAVYLGRHVQKEQE